MFRLWRISASGSDAKLDKMSSRAQFESPAGDSPSQARGSPRTSHGAWSDRLGALKNIPPVLHFVWESGPSIVFWNIAIRITERFFRWALGLSAATLSTA
jgi:ATP-binding cassette subfamily B protein